MSLEATGLVLAVLHHILVFSLAAIIAAEFVLLHSEMAPASLDRLVRVDRYYGVTASLILIVGAGRIFWGLKGLEYYLNNWLFWAKMATFLLVGLLSIMPTVRFISWRGHAKANSDYRVPAAELATVKALVRAEAALFVLIPVFAAAMTRSY